MLVVAWVYWRAQINKVAINMHLQELINLTNNTVMEMVQISCTFQYGGLSFFFLGDTRFFPIPKYCTT